MTSDEAIRRALAIRRYQENKWVHPLTCGNDSQHTVLMPAIVPDVYDAEQFTVILLCSDCPYRQSFIPAIDYDLMANHSLGFDPFQNLPKKS